MQVVQVLVAVFTRCCIACEVSPYCFSFWKCELLIKVSIWGGLCKEYRVRTCPGLVVPVFFLYLFFGVKLVDGT